MIPYFENYTPPGGHQTPPAGKGQGAVGSVVSYRTRCRLAITNPVAGRHNQYARALLSEPNQRTTPAERCVPALPRVLSGPRRRDPRADGNSLSPDQRGRSGAPICFPPSRSSQTRRWGRLSRLSTLARAQDSTCCLIGTSTSMEAASVPGSRHRPCESRPRSAENASRRYLKTSLPWRSGLGLICTR